MIPETVALMAIVIAAWAIYFFVLPWMCKLLAVYILHGLRDRVFRVGLSFPAARSTVLFRDIDFFLADALHVVRDADYAEVVSFVGDVMVDRPARPCGSPRWKAEHYRREVAEVFCGAEGYAALTDLLVAFDRVSIPVAFRMATGHPGMLLVALLASIFAFGKLAVALYSGRPVKLVDDVSVTITRTAERDPLPRFPKLEAARILTGGYLFT